MCNKSHLQPWFLEFQAKWHMPLLTTLLFKPLFFVVLTPFTLNAVNTTIEIGSELVEINPLWRQKAQWQPLCIIFEINILVIFYDWKLNFSLATIVENMSELSGLLEKGRNYWCSCRVCLRAKFSIRQQRFLVKTRKSRNNDTQGTEVIMSTIFCGNDSS